MKIAFLVLLNHLQASRHCRTAIFKYGSVRVFENIYMKKRDLESRLQQTTNGKREIRVFVFLKNECIDENSTTQFWPLILSRKTTQFY